MVAKSSLPAQRLRESNPRIVEKPIMTFARGKTLYYCGKVLLSNSIQPYLMLAAYLPMATDKAGLRDEEISSSMFGLHVPSSMCPGNLSSLSQKEKWEFVRRTLSEWSSE